MSIQSEIDRIISVKNNLREALIDKGAILTGQSTLEEFVSAVAGIQTGGGGGTDTADGNAQPGDVFTGMIFYNSNGRQVGTMATAYLQKPELEFNAADATVGVTVRADEGKIYGENTEEYYSFALSDLIEVASGGNTITPGVEDRTISGGQYIENPITIKGDANLLANNIKSGVSIFGVSGTYEGTGGGGGSEEGASPAKLFCATLIY